MRSIENLFHLFLQYPLVTLVIRIWTTRCLVIIAITLSTYPRLVRLEEIETFMMRGLITCPLFTSPCMVLPALVVIVDSDCNI